MLNFEKTGQFDKDTQKLKKQGKDLSFLEEAIDLIISEKTLGATYKNHKLSPKNLGNWECHIQGRASDWLLIYKFYPENNLVIFVRTGSHSELFS